MSQLIFEIIFTVLCIISFITGIICNWPLYFIVGDGILILLGIMCTYIAFKIYKLEKSLKNK